MEADNCSVSDTGMVQLCALEICFGSTGPNNYCTATGNSCIQLKKHAACSLYFLHCAQISFRGPILSHYFYKREITACLEGDLTTLHHHPK